MTSKLKIILSVGIIIIVAAAIGISRWVGAKHSVVPATSQHDLDRSEPLSPPTSSVSDLFTAIDTSNAHEGASATADTDQTPKNDGSDFDQSANTNGI